MLHRHSIFHIISFLIFLWNKSPPAWTQEVYRLPRIKYSICCPIRGGGGLPVSGWGVSRLWTGGTPPMDRGIPHPWLGTPCLDLAGVHPPGCKLTNKLKLLPSPIHSDAGGNDTFRLISWLNDYLLCSPIYEVKRRFSKLHCTSYVGNPSIRRWIHTLLVLIDKIVQASQTDNC